MELGSDVAMDYQLDNVPFASQSSVSGQTEKENDAPHIFSSPPKTLNGQRQRRPPTVTPKRFSRFFTLRSSLDSRSARQSRAGRQLRDITKNAVNIRVNHQNDILAKGIPSLPPAKRRKYTEDLSSSPPLSSPIKCQQQSPLKHQYVFEDVESELSEDDYLPSLPEEPLLPIRRLQKTTTNHQLLTRSFGDRPAPSRHFTSTYDSTTYASTADFCTRPEDEIRWQQYQSSLAFCTTPCNNNSLVAVGTEDGMVHMVDTAPDTDYLQPHISFRIHKNAIMDLTFSPCDYILATSSGDQTCRIVDMQSQKILSVLAGHSSSVKQIRFRPDDNKLLTTSGRDGLVNVWDLRCSQRAVQTLSIAQAEDDKHPLPMHLRPYASMTVGPAHRARNTKDQIVRTGQDDMSSVSGVSITSIEHLHGSRGHLLLSASGSNASLKLWDLRVAGRNTKSDRFGYEVPVSCTAEPQSQRRRYGVSSLVLSTDGSKAYSICKDSTVWVYSTQHLIMGSAPESINVSKRTRLSPPEKTKEGLGPLYGLRNDSMRISNFYIRATMRKATAQHEELLAVASEDPCVVLFSTDERTLRQQASKPERGEETAKPSWFPDTSQDSSTEIFHNVGTPLVRGHTKETTTLAFAHGGELLSNSDDYTARCWREDATLAKHLRQCGEGEGSRWSSGWAEVPEQYDEDDC